MARVGARKAIKATTSTTAKKIAKEVAKKGVEHALEAGAEYALNKIDQAGNTAINKGVSPELVHNVSDAVKRGAHSGLSNLSKAAVNKIHTSIDSLAYSDNDDDDEEPPHKKKKKNLSHLIV